MHFTVSIINLFSQSSKNTPLFTLPYDIETRLCKLLCQLIECEMPSTEDSKSKLESDSKVIPSMTFWSMTRGIYYSGPIRL
jgi:hypothetical protein